jgi:hypothetical protein
VLTARKKNERRIGNPGANGKLGNTFSLNCIGPVTAKFNVRASVSPAWITSVDHQRGSIVLDPKTITSFRADHHALTRVSGLPQSRNAPAPPAPDGLFKKDRTRYGPESTPDPFNSRRPPSHGQGTDPAIKAATHSEQRRITRPDATAETLRLSSVSLP